MSRPFPVGVTPAKMPPLDRTECDFENRSKYMTQLPRNCLGLRLDGFLIRKSRQDLQACPSRISLSWIMLLAMALVDRPGFGAERIWQVTTRDQARISGALQGESARVIQFLNATGKSTGKPIGRPLSLSEIERCELPHRPRILPAVHARQLQLLNGDRLHSDLLQSTNPDLTPRQQDLTLSGPFISPCRLKWNGLAAVSHLPGALCIGEFDFESVPAGWFKGLTSDQPVLDQHHVHSGKFSLKSCSEQPSIQYRPSRPMQAGWIQSHFYVESETITGAETTIRFCFAPQARSTVLPDKTGPGSAPPVDKQIETNASTVDVCLAGPTSRFDVRFPGPVDFTRQRLLRRAGWHTLMFQFSAESITVMIDGNLLASRQLVAGMAMPLQHVELRAAATSSPLWIDDFLLLEAAATQHLPILQYAQDEVSLVSGDDLFGTIAEMRSDTVRLASGQREMRIPWPQISQVRLADQDGAMNSISGWICRVDLQPLWIAPDWRTSDTLHAAVTSCDADRITLQHSILGSIIVPLDLVRQIKPAFYGWELQFVGRTIHLGDEVKSQFRVPVPKGTEWSRTFRLDPMPTGRTRLRLRTNNLEPSGPATRASALLNRLQAGEFVTEVHLNGKRISILNEHVSGHGTAELPQEIVLEIPQNSLRQGANSLGLVLKPSYDAVPEYDDFELLWMSLEIEPLEDPGRPVQR